MSLSGADGAVRAAEVKVSNGRVLQRAMQHLYPLEVNHSSVSDADNVDDTSASVATGAMHAALDIEQRPRRQAAIEATNRLRALSM